MRATLSTFQRNFGTFIQRYRQASVCLFTTDILHDKEKAEENVYIARLERENKEKMRIEREKRLHDDESSDSAAKKIKDDEKKK